MDLPDESKPPTVFRGWHDRGYLPRYDFANVTQTINFRLGDSLPASLRQEWESEDDDAARYRIKEYLLDQGHGSCHLGREPFAKMMEKALLFFNESRYRLHAWVIMPNHVHVVVRIYEKYSMSSVLQSWRSFTGHEAKKLLPDVKDNFWARDYYDRYVRDTKHHWNAVRYFEKNPVKARLVESPEHWGFSSARFDRSRENGYLIIPNSLYESYSIDSPARRRRSQSLPSS